EAKHYLKECESSIEYTDNKYDALNQADALLLVTEWKEFRSPDFDEISKRLNAKVIIDGRNQYKADVLGEIGFEYYQIGVSI
ncbi:MAG: UDP-glucose 6-dehydrogenase, partial [Pseudomonadota bacterium]